MVKENVGKLYRSMGLTKWLTGFLESEFMSNGASRDGPNRKPNGPDILADTKYISWLEEHPCALASFPQMMGAAQGKQIVVFLDYDGTLSPIVADPERAFMSDPMRWAVREVARQFPTAVISGRSRDKVFGFVKLEEVYYAGSHGMDIMGPAHLHVSSYDAQYCHIINTQDDKGNEFTIFQPAKDYLPSINKMLKEVKKRIREVPGAYAEDNRFCVSVHYRRVLDEEYGKLEEIIQNVLSDYPCFHLTRGKKVMEIRPSIKWNKGDAIKYLLHTLGFPEPSNVVPFYLGDDTTDEDAFEVLRCRGQGYPIIVSSVARETSATHSLRNPSQVFSFLVKLAGSTKTLPS